MYNTLVVTQGKDFMLNPTTQCFPIRKRSNMSLFQNEEHFIRTNLIQDIVHVECPALKLVSWHFYLDYCSYMKALNANIPFLLTLFFPLLKFLPELNLVLLLNNQICLLQCLIIFLIPQLFSSGIN